MKKVGVIILALMPLAGKTQCNSEYDTLRKNEIAVNVMPVFLFLGEASMPNNIALQAGYRHYFKNRVVLRTAISYFPWVNRSYYSGMPFYEGRISGVNVFKVYETGGGGKTQFTIGMEKILRAKRFQHGLGVDIFFNHKYENRGEYYYYESDSVTNSDPFYSPTENTIDSLGYYSNSQHLGFGLQVFYSIRIRVAQRWYLSATMGPSFNFAFVQTHFWDRPKNTESTFNGTTFEIPGIPFVSDLSLCYRF